MSKKAAKPTLSGQRIKTRKRDEKEKLDPVGFRDVIIQGLNETGNDLEKVSKFLDQPSSKLNYRSYADSLIHILLTGGLLAPGGTLIEDPDPTKVSRTDVCVFCCEDDNERLQGFREVFHKLIRRYRYLDKVFLDEMTGRIIPCMKGYKEHERTKLAKITAMFLAANQLEASCLKGLFEDHLIKDDISLQFATTMFRTWLQECNLKDIRKALTTHGLEAKLMNLFPLNKRSMENFEKHFREADLEQIIEYQKRYQFDVSQKRLQDFVTDAIQNEKPIKDIIATSVEMMKQDNLAEHDVVINIWNAIMKVVEWNKKEELMADQALLHLKMYSPLLRAFTEGLKSEVMLLHRIQEHCYENMNFMKLFTKIVMLFYNQSVLGEDSIKRWYYKKNNSKGRSLFVDQLKKFIEWLETAEEETDSEEEEEKEEKEEEEKEGEN